MWETEKHKIISTATSQVLIPIRAKKNSPEKIAVGFFFLIVITRPQSTSILHEIDKEDLSTLFFLCPVHFYFSYVLT